jgi:hypothetical protein
MLPAVPDKAQPPARTPDPGLARLAATTLATAAVLGVVIGLIADSVILGVLFAVLGAGVRLGVAAWQRVRALPTETIDPWALPEPWRGLVQQALDARKQFNSAAEAWPQGPLRERLVSLEPAVEAEVSGVWVAARQGATLSGGYPVGAKRSSAADLSAELQAVHLERADLSEGNQVRRDELDRAEQAIAAQLQAARRAESTSQAVEDRLRLLVARLDESVTSLVGLTAGPGGAGDLEGRGTVIEGAAASIEGLGREIAALQAGIGEGGQLPAAPKMTAPLPKPPDPAGPSGGGTPSPPPRS